MTYKNLETLGEIKNEIQALTVDIIEDDAARGNRSWDWIFFIAAKAYYAKLQRIFASDGSASGVSLKLMCALGDFIEKEMKQSADLKFSKYLSSRERESVLRKLKSIFKV